MAQKKKTTKQNKKQRQKQRQYQKQSVVVNVNTGTKRRTRSSGGGRKAVATPLIQTLPLQYAPQLMFDQSSVLTDDSRNRIFQSEIKNGISLLNKEVEKKTENIVNSLFELDQKKRDAWMEQQKIFDEGNKRGRKKRGLTNARGGAGTENDTDDEISRIIERNKTRATTNPLPTPRDNSINLSRIQSDTDEENIAETPIRTSRSRKPLLPTPIDNSINMRTPSAVAQQEENVAENTQSTISRSRLDEQFTKVENNKWKCNTCNPTVTILATSRYQHLRSASHKNGGARTRQPFR